jgi:pimeloyl-ACP methyl ester carboxylesterase
MRVGSRGRLVSARRRTVDDMTTLHAKALISSSPIGRAAAPGVGSRSAVARSTACHTAGAGVAVATAFDGPQPWPLVRGFVAIALTALVARASRQSSARHAAAGRALVGFVALVVGVGIGVPHLLKTGVSWETTGGVLALAAGLVTLVAGIADVLHRTRWWHKLVAIPACAVAVIVTGLPFSVALVSTNTPPLALGDRTPAEVGLEYEDVELVTDDDVRLDAWYVPSTNGAAIVLLAGAGSTRDDEIDRASVLARHGYGVLLLDVRGHGGSAGEAMLLGWYGERDVKPAVDYLLARPDVRDRRVGLVGMSMGGQQAVAAAGADHRIRAVVADGVVGRHSSEIAAEHAVDRFMGWLAMVATELTTAAPHPAPLRDAVRRAAPNRVLVIAGEDVWLERDFADVLHTASPDTVEVWVAPNSGHTEAFAKHPTDWEQHVSDFLDDALAAA